MSNCTILLVLLLVHISQVKNFDLKVEIRQNFIGWSGLYWNFKRRNVSIKSLLTDFNYFRQTLKLTKAWIIPIHTFLWMCKIPQLSHLGNLFILTAVPNKKYFTQFQRCKANKVKPSHSCRHSKAILIQCSF